jgi:hypothetical protein
MIAGSIRSFDHLPAGRAAVRCSRGFLVWVASSQPAPFNTPPRPPAARSHQHPFPNAPELKSGLARNASVREH